MKNTKVILLVVILIVAFAGGGFFTGIKYQESKRPVDHFGNFQGAGNRQFQQRAQGFRPVNGEIISADDESITVKLQDGSSKIVLLSDTVQVSKSADATKADLKVGEKVAAFGTENSDGSITAANIQLNPASRGLPSGGYPRTLRLGREEPAALADDDDDDDDDDGGGGGGGWLLVLRMLQKA